MYQIKAQKVQPPALKRRNGGNVTQIGDEFNGQIKAVFT